MIPDRYKYLLNEPAPKMLLEGLKLVGIKEVVGSADNPVILGWAKDLGLDKVYKSDETPWCGLVHAWLAVKCGKTPVDTPLWALSWAKFGNKVDEPMLGDTVVFKRLNGGHVGLYVGEDDDFYHVMGGNQGNMYGFTRIAKARLFAARRPVYSIATPPNVRKIFLDASGVISTDEK